MSAAIPRRAGEVATTLGAGLQAPNCGVPYLRQIVTFSDATRTALPFVHLLVVRSRRLVTVGADDCIQTIWGVVRWAGPES
jgi:hypothetical protein